MSLIPVGILASAGGGFDYELITTVAGTGSSGTITLSSIPQGYSHLQLRIALVLTSDAGSQMLMRMNGVTTASYSQHRLFGTGSSLASQGFDPGITSIQLSGGFGGMSTNPTVGIIELYDYANTSRNKTVRAFTGSRTPGGSFENNLSSGAFISTAAVNSLTLLASSGNFAASTRISLYGIK